MDDYYTLRENDNSLEYCRSKLLEGAAPLKHLSNELRFKILKMLSEKPRYPLELAKSLNKNEQTIYYHLKALQRGSFIEVADTKEIRGTIAKSFRPSAQSFTITVKPVWQDSNELFKQHKSSIKKFLEPFSLKGFLNTPIVVGSPDPHGPLKARARDGHYASDLALFLGEYLKLPMKFMTHLDVEIKKSNESMILLGGPVANIITNNINTTLPVRFSDEKPFGLISSITNKKYYDEHIGLIVKTPNPHNQNKTLLLLAGISAEGTKSAVIGLTRFTRLILNNYTGQKTWCRVVQGYDLDADGKIDSIEVLE